MRTRSNYEGGGINNGRADYRDHHLGPELKQFENLQFAHRNTKATLLGDGRSAYVTSMYALKAKMGAPAGRPQRSSSGGEP